MIVSLSDRVENIVGKGENAVYQSGALRSHTLIVSHLIATMFSKAPFFGVLKSQDCEVKG